jgi:hypothetical protein
MAFPLGYNGDAQKFEEIIRPAEGFSLAWTAPSRAGFILAAHPEIEMAPVVFPPAGERGGGIIPDPCAGSKSGLPKAGDESREGPMTLTMPPADGESAPSRPLRRRRARSFLPFLGQEERDRTLDDLAQRAFPRLNFFLFTLLAAVLFSLAQILSWPVLWALGLVLAPLLSPLTGAALGLVTSSLTFTVRNLAALALGWILAFLAAWLIVFLAFVSDPGKIYPLLEPVALIATVLAAAWLTWRFLRGAPDSWMPSAVVSYLCLYPLCAAGWTAATGKGDGAITALLAWAIRVSLALLASMGTYLALGFRPSERTARAYVGIAAMVLIGVMLIGAWAVRGTPGAEPAPIPMSTSTSTATFTPTPEPSITLTATDTPPPSQTPIPSATFTATYPSVKAIVRGTGAGGVFLRDAPNGKKIDSLNDGDEVIVIGPAVQADTTWWIPVRTASGKIGWMAMEFCATVTPTSKPA